jgi:uncharacterized protein
MLISFSISNFRSFLTEQTFSLVASKRLSASHESHAVPIPDSDEKVLRTAVLYGANGAGKSNLFRAFQYIEQLIFRPRGKKNGTGRVPFLFAGGDKDPSLFDVQFVANEKLYRYGLVVDDVRIVKEWLVQVVGTREKIVFERQTDEQGKVTVDVAGASIAAGPKLRALATVGAPQNQLFLATIHANLETTDIGVELSAVLEWFMSLTLIAPNANYGRLGHKLSKEPDFLNFAGEFLKSSSTGVDHLLSEKTEISEDELKATFPPSLSKKLLKGLNEDAEDMIVLPLGEGQEILIERGDGNHYYRITIQAAHLNKSGKHISLDLSEESDGTRRLLNLLPALHDLRTNSAVYFIDEIDRSMHPILVRKFMESFLRSCEGGHRQIIVTTHESSLLNLELLRRDEVWFAEKDTEGATQLYSLVDFRVRKDLEIQKHYLQGRFGAIPFLGPLDSLLEVDGGA